MKSFSCIIPFYNSQHIDIQLLALKSLNISVFEYVEFIFVNDGSKWEYLEHLQKWVWKDNNFLIISLEKQKIKTNRVTLARNMWVEKAKSENIILIDQDTIISQAYIDTISQVELKRWNIIIGPYFGYNNEIKKLTWEQINTYIHSWVLQGREYQDFRVGSSQMKNSSFIWKYFCASNLLIRKQDFFSTGWFDENITSWWDEDVEFGYRLSQSKNISFREDLRVLNLSKKLYDIPYNILEDIHVESLFDNMFRNFKKHRSKEYLAYILERYAWLNDHQKEFLSASSKKIIQWI